MLPTKPPSAWFLKAFFLLVLQQRPAWKLCASNSNELWWLVVRKILSGDCRVLLS